MLIATDRTVCRLIDTGVEFIHAQGDIAAIAESTQHQVIALKNGEMLIQTDGKNHTIATGISLAIECLLILDENPLRMIIGTAEAHLYRFLDGKTERIDAFDHMPVRSHWHTPWGGPPDVRSLAATSDGWIYADIHVGSIIRSPDQGNTWEPVTPDLHEDVHQVATSPKNPDRVYANTADAVYISSDRGRSWIHRASGFPYRYGRAIAVHPGDPDCLLTTVSKGPHGNAESRLYRSDDAGQSWEHVTAGFPESVAHNIDTFHIAFSRDGRAWAVLDRELHTSSDRGNTWEHCCTAPESIQMIACV